MRDLCDDIVVLVVEGPEGEDPEGLLLHSVPTYAVVVDGVLLQEPEGLLLAALGDGEEELLVLLSAGSDLREGARERITFLSGRSVVF